MKQRYLYYVLLCISVQNSTAKNPDSLPAPYNSIETALPFDDHGWFHESTKQGLTRLINQYNPTTIVEIGTWLGKSTIYMAKRLAPSARLYTVDHFLGSPVLISSPHITKPRIPKLYQQFLSNVIHANTTSHHDLTQIIVPIKNDSLSAAKAFNQTADIVYIDGSHLEEDVYKDIIAWYTHLRSGGVMCGDDYNWWHGSYFPVQKAVSRAAKALGQTVSVQGNRFWQFSPKP